jgi:hypothetical protein
MFEDLEKAKESLREIDRHLTIGNDEAVRAAVRHPINLIDQHENRMRAQLA